MVFFAWMDSRQIISFFEINTEQGWDLYNTYTGPAIWLTWYVVLGVIGLIWYVISKDKSEALALTIALSIMLFFGAQDVLFFHFAGTPMTDNMCWADVMLPIQKISDFLGEPCPTALSFTLSGVIGVIIAFFVFNKLKRSKW